MTPERTFNLRVCLMTLLITSGLFVMLQIVGVDHDSPGTAVSPAQDRLPGHMMAVAVSQYASSPPSTTLASLERVADMGRVMGAPTGRCNKTVNMGGNWYCAGFDGNKDICLDPWLVPSFNSCIAYSFGVGVDISFEVGLVDAWGCTVYLHDPSVRHSKEFYYKHHVFRKIGIAKKAHTDTAGRQFETYREALAINGHEHADIHYLKLDVEGAEYDILPDLIDSGILNNVYQLHMEIHSFAEDKKHYTRWMERIQKEYQILRRLEDSGFRRVHSTVNNLLEVQEVVSGVPNCCLDVLWINENKRKLAVSTT